MSRTITAVGVFALLAGSAFAADMDAPIISGVPIRPPSYDYYKYLQDEPEAQRPERGSGFIEGQYTYSSPSDIDVNANIWAIRGSLNLDTGNLLNIQVDGNFARTTVEDADLNTFGGAVHAYYRPGQRYAIGGFFGASRVGTSIFDDLGVTGIDDDATDYVGGIEGAFFTDPATFYAKAGYGQARWENLKGDHYLGAIGTRIYATENLRLDVEGALNRLEGYGGHIDLYSLTTRVNYRPDGIPMTLFGGYRFDRAKVSDIDATGDMNSVFAGLRYSFGSGTLKEEERGGPVWTTNTLLP